MVKTSFHIAFRQVANTSGSMLTIERIARILADRITERCGARLQQDLEADILITLSFEEKGAAEGYAIKETAEGTIRIHGASMSGLLFGVGRFLHTSHFDERGFIPSDWRGESSPDCPVRGIYFASHFFNWYHVTPLDDQERYIEDLALWGINHICLIFPFINLDGWDDEETGKAFHQIKNLYQVIANLGLRTTMIVVANQSFRTTPQHLRAVPLPDPTGRRGNNGVKVCGSNPEARSYLREQYEKLFHELRDASLNQLVLWPYDEGGCSCDQCFPWGAERFIELSQEIAGIARKQFPELEIILSTWCYDTPEEGEWEGLSRYLEEDGAWVSYIMADAHEDFPAYPLKVGVPGNKPLINFPEISMWGLSPWGGFGANPLPARYHRLLNQVREVVQGGYAYSEGIFDDINKVVVSQFYWDKSSDAMKALELYIRYEYSPAIVAEALEIIRTIEDNHVRAAGGQRPDVARAEAAYEKLLQADGKLPERARKSWRWRILYLRLLLDVERYRLVAQRTARSGINWGELLLDNKSAQAAFRELIAIFNAKVEDDGTYPEHSWVRPPLRKS